MGKSTVLTHLSKQIKQKFPTKWVVRIDLNDHTDALEALKNEQISKEKAIKFVSERMLKLQPGFELELFKQCCEQKQNVRVVIMLDGFDEISPYYKETVIDLLKALRETTVEQLWVTTRPHLREELEDNLQQLSYTLEHFSEENQVEFLRKFWYVKGCFTEVGNVAEEKFETKVEIYAKHLIGKLSPSISDEDKQFTGIPLQCRMLAEAFDENVKVFCQSKELVPELPFKLELFGLYEIFLNRKYDICFEEKFKIPKTNVGAAVARKQWVKTNVENHQILALKMLFSEEQLVPFLINSQGNSLYEDLTRTGIVQISNDGKLHFIHRTFAEFYVADYFVNLLTKDPNISQQI
jgi:NTP pyrophosphatase (non-canonical NTP hydrolase)